MNTRGEEKSDPPRSPSEATVAEARESGMRAKVLVPEIPAPSQRHPHHAMAAVLAIHDLLRPGVTAREAFLDLVGIVERTCPLHAITILTKDGHRPLTWVSRDGGVRIDTAESLAAVALRYFDGVATLDELEGALETMGRRCLTLPIADDDGAVRGLVCVTPRGSVGDEALPFLSFVARHLAGVLVRELRIATEAARPTLVGAIVDGAANNELAAALVTTFDYDVALGHVARVITDHVACGCVVDIVSDRGLQRIAHVPPRVDSAIESALAEVVADVVRNVRPAIARQRSGDSSNDDAAASRARATLAMDWLVCVPIAFSQGPALGAITICGMEERHPPVPLSIAVELAKRAAIAIENRRAYRSAIDAVRDRDHVLAMVSHDLKNPLGVILMSAAHILETSPEVEPRFTGRRQVEAIQRSAKRMLKLVGDLLDLAAMEAGQLSVRPAECDLSRIVVDAVKELAPQANASGIALHPAVSESLPRIWADEHRIAQVLSNLVGNALKFTRVGGHVRVSASACGVDFVSVTVEDDGRGISADDLPHVFERFWQAPGGMRVGSGLGLAICKSIVERNGGRIWVESNTSPATSGTKVSFTLRAAGAGR